MNSIQSTTHLGLFSTLVSVSKNFISEEERNLIFDKCLSDESFVHEAIDINGTSTHSYNSNFIDSFPEIKNRLNLKFNEYCNQLNLRSVVVSNSWFNIQNKGSTLVDHTHPESVLSAALYINVSKESSGLYFFNPNQFIGHFFSYLVNKVSDSLENNHSTTATVEYFKLIPENCQLIIFPSWLKHGSKNEINNFDNRTVLSFNTLISSS